MSREQVEQAVNRILEPQRQLEAKVMECLGGTIKVAERPTPDGMRQERKVFRASPEERSAWDSYFAALRKTEPRGRGQHLSAFGKVIGDEPVRNPVTAFGKAIQGPAESETEW